MRKLYLQTCWLLTGFFAFGQNETDLYRYSNTFNEGGARFQAMSGSFGALGADFGCARINPAGFGRYSTNQFSFGMLTASTTNSSDFKGTTTNAGVTKAKLGTIGAVFTSDHSARQSGWLYQQFSIGYNSIANFKNTIHYAGQQYESLLDGFAAQATGYDPSTLVDYFPFSTNIAYQSYALDYDQNTQSYYSHLDSTDMLHDRTVTMNGGMGEFFIGGSANYMNKLYIGANIGFQIVNYKETTLHHESVTNPDNSFRGFDYQYNLKSSGTGANLKLGAIYLPSESFRIGLAVQTKTFMQMTDLYSADMVSYFSDQTYYVPDDLKPSGTYKYKVRTPGRAVASLAYIFREYGCINVDVEYLNYGKARLRPSSQSADSYTFSAENAAASSRFTRAVNVRVGAEAVIRSMFFIRGGFALYQKGDSAIVNTGGKFDIGYSGGFGVRLGKWTVDASLRTLNQTYNYYAFPLSYANVTRKTYYVALTAMIKF